jgi:hypothetical protein
MALTTVQGQMIYPAQSGSVIQTVYQNYGSNTAYSANAAFIDTGITATITPQFSTSKILIFVNLLGLTLQSSGGADTLGLVLTDGSNNNLYGLSGSNLAGYSSAPYYAQSNAFVYSPATTSALTFKVRAKMTVSNWQINNYNISMPTPTSSLILMEIAV